MKRMRFCLNSLFAVILIACLLGVSPQPALAYGRVFTVSPTGGDDTSNIQQAFAHAQASGPGATVQFTAGTFITDLITVVNFKGNVKGMGQDKTIITARPNLSCQAAIDQGFLPSLFRFSEGSIQMSDLTLKIANPDPCASYTFSWWGSDYTTWLYGGLTFAGPAPVNMTQCGFYKRGKIEATIDRVSVLVGDGVTLVAGIVGGGDYVTQNSCSGYGYNTETRLQITHSYFENTFDNIDVQNVDGGSLVITGNKLHEGGESFVIFDIANAPLLISDNILENPTYNGMNIRQGAYPDIQVPAAPAQFIVRNNTIQIKDNANGLLLVDNTAYLGGNEIPRMKILVEKNQISQDGVGTWGLFGIGVHNALVLNNRFTGRGDSGIVNGYPDSYGDFPSAGWLISGNDLQSLKPYPPATSMNKIVLGELSQNCRVVTSSTDDVLNLGTGNVIIGGRLHSSGLPPAFHPMQKIFRH